MLPQPIRSLSSGAKQSFLIIRCLFITQDIAKCAIEVFVKTNKTNRRMHVELLSMSFRWFIGRFADSVGCCNFLLFFSLNEKRKKFASRKKRRSKQGFAYHIIGCIRRSLVDLRQSRSSSRFPISACGSEQISEKFTFVILSAASARHAISFHFIAYYFFPPVSFRV